MHSDNKASRSLDAIRGTLVWQSIDKLEQSTIEAEIKGFETEMVGAVQSRLALGARLAAIQLRLKPHNMFGSFLRAYNLKKSSAWKAINSFNNAKLWLPDAVIKAAAARNMNMLGESPDAPVGVYSNVVRRLPPPTDGDEKKITEWLESIELARRREIARTRKRADAVGLVDDETLLKECWREVNKRLRKLPNGNQARREWMKRLVGMLLTQTGVSNTQSFSPEAVPSSFIPKVGRPKTIEGQKLAAQA